MPRNTIADAFNSPFLLKASMRPRRDAAEYMLNERFGVDLYETGFNEAAA